MLLRVAQLPVEAVVAVAGPFLGVGGGFFDLPGGDVRGVGGVGHREGGFVFGPGRDARVDAEAGVAEDELAIAVRLEGDGAEVGDHGVDVHCAVEGFFVLEFFNVPFAVAFDQNFVEGFGAGICRDEQDGEGNCREEATWGFHFLEVHVVKIGEFWVCDGWG
jgi:hypothetical protein